MLRRTFVAGSLAAAVAAPNTVETALGPVDVSKLGVTLIHEHLLVDSAGAEVASPSRYKEDEVVAAALPKLKELRSRGCQTLVECTPAYLGRDPKLLKRLSKESGVHLVTNTGYYGANKDKHVPAHAHTEPAEKLAERWIAERKDGIEGSGIRPAFMKIGVDAGPLSEIDAKLIDAACLCHKSTGLRMHVHTGNGVAAMDIFERMAKHGTTANALVWVHAQNEKDRSLHIAAAKAGAWLEFDGVNPKSHADHLNAVSELAERGFLNLLLISQDSGWYRVGEPAGGQFNGYTYIFDKFAKALKERGVDPMKLLKENPARVLTVAPR